MIIDPIRKKKKICYQGLWQIKQIFIQATIINIGKAESSLQILTLRDWPKHDVEI